LERGDECTRVLSLSRNFGHQIAITAGLDHADRRADAVLVMDADLENPPALIPRLLEPLDRGHDVVLGVRASGRVVGVGKRLLSRAFYALFNRVSEIPIAPGAPDFFVLSRRAREALARMGDQRRFLRAMVAWIGFSRTQVAYVPPPRAAGRSKYSLARRLRLASDALFAFSWAPLKLVTWGGLACVALGALLLGRGALAGATWDGAGLAGLLCLLSGVQMLALRLIGGYVLRIFEHSQGRPLYIVREGSDEPQPEPKLLEVPARSPRRASRST
jgi:dolichol-phosphate mannosyltransferase